jgi:NADPH:quinone reductase-like Zn-dependent oxidoreductase
VQSARAKPGAAGVKLHDIHHVLTGYDTTWRGKAEIGAWEIASGCGRHYAFVDVVIDTVGGELARRSAALLVPGGCLVSSVKRVDIESAGRNDVRSEYLIVEITTERLTQIAELLEAGELSVRVGTVLPLESARQAHELMEAEAARMHGKIVLRASEADSSSEDP